MASSYEERSAELDKLAYEFSVAESDRIYLENFRHSKLAILMKEALSKNPNLTSAAAQEREARSHQDYIDLLEALKAATEKAEYAKWLLKNAHMKASIWQTKKATERAEMTLR